MFSLYKKEVKSYFCSPFAYVISGLLLMVFSLSFVYSISQMDSNVLRFSFPEIIYNNFFFFIFIIPLLTMRTFADERRSHTETLWLSAPIGIGQVVLAKFLAVATVYLLMIVLSFFFPLVCALHGSVVISGLICGYIGFFFWGLFCIAVGMFASAMTESPIIAAVLGEVAMLLVYFLDVFTNTDFVQSVPWLSAALNWFSIRQRYLGFAEGFLALSDLVFFISLTAVVLIWTIILIQKRRQSRA